LSIGIAGDQRNRTGLKQGLHSAVASGGSGLACPASKHLLLGPIESGRHVWVLHRRWLQASPVGGTMEYQSKLKTR
jgi:hypothetical protein